jgi:citrate lyase beta subunit
MRRTWLFVPGADAAAHSAAARSGADVIILELEDFTPAELRPQARRLAAAAFRMWKSSGAAAAVRVNPLLCRS